MSRSIVTGGAGFIGSHLVEALAGEGDEVLVVDDLSTGRRENLEQVLGNGSTRLAVADISDPAPLEREVAAFGPDRAFHLAAQADVRKAVADPGFDARVNVLGTINLLEALRASGGCPVVFASTGGAIYGEGEGRALPFDEAAELAPETAYGASKLAGEVYVGLYRRLHGMPGVALRFGNVYGPRQDPHGEAGVVAIFCGRLLEGTAPTIFGDGRQTRDYVYVLDVVGALLAGARALAGGEGRVAGSYNVATGIETSVLELAERLAALAGGGVEPVHAPARAGEVQRASIDPAAAARDLGWRPHTALADGLRETYESIAATLD